jgi:uncharacterized protein (DUF2126 family)/transglutaminase-like putative cysteine protease
MAIYAALKHRTHYTYDKQVGFSPHTVRLRPAPHCRTRILSYALKVEPAEHFINWQQDPHGNHLARLVFPKKAGELLFEVDLVAELAVYNPFDFFLEPEAEKYPFTYDALSRKDLTPYLEVTATGKQFDAWCAAAQRTGERTITFLTGLNQDLQKRIRYTIRLEPGVQTPEETLRLGSGSCRDSAWLLVQGLRRLGLAARFVSGYLIQMVPDEKPLTGPSGPASDFTDLHAWAEVFLPGAGWVGMDPTSGLMAGEGHLPLACTPDPISAAPITGGVDPCEAKLIHEMKVTRLLETPRVTKPYTEEQWREIEALGHQVDADLVAGDVRLTMGGEPTFVASDNRDEAEWNTEALGPRKRGLAGQLLRRLQDKFAPGGLLFYGQGKWYPGEPLPRWALACHWRKDGQPIWRDPALVADENRDYGHGEPEARALIKALAARLGLTDQHLMPAYEDAWHHLLRERRLPSNVNPHDSKLKNPEDRARLARVFEQGLDHIIGYVLPLRGDAAGPGKTAWSTGPWYLRSNRLFLIPGDSPVGLRLPLDSQPWVKETDYPWTAEPDPLVAQPPLPPAATGAPAKPAKSDPKAPPAPGLGVSSPWVVRTALCVEPRHGRLHVFLPPLDRTEDFLNLVAAIEAAARELKLPVVLEGSSPPVDPRLNCLKVTPDPGVIEVNLQPAHSWDELVKNTTAVYEEARQTGLAAEKFLVDGRHTGTGGGNHIIIGGATPADSPVLRRPDLLRSLISYWNNHPALSYLFSGLFIGPTSQHPRVDEARHDSLHELEVAFGQVPKNGSCPPWLVDRLFRHLLVDATGNTHRSEFCLDKLYAPDSSSGRLGLVELRAFEMPPHARMSLAQHLLLRALIARFWRRPYEAPLIRWGTQLHDRFMLHHFVAQDFQDVLADLTESGYPFRPEWFAPHLEFRFPLAGEIDFRGVHLELRTALEPWHVLGEEAGAGGTVRYVDSSVERLQVRATGLVGGRHLVTCNGRALPLHPTGTQGEFVAGVRFRAWQPANCLHPTIGVHTPLTFHLVDTWNQRATAGCAYHVMHPGGRHYDQFPVNACEAESRRLARFFAFGQPAGVMQVAPPEPNPDFPFTLDLRRPHPSTP